MLGIKTAVNCHGVSQVVAKPKKKKTKEDGGEGEGKTPQKRSRRGTADGGRKRAKKPHVGEPGYDPYDFTSSEEEEEEDTPTAKSHDPADEAPDSMDTGGDGSTSVSVTLDPEK